MGVSHSSRRRRSGNETSQSWEEEPSALLRGGSGYVVDVEHMTEGDMTASPQSGGLRRRSSYSLFRGSSTRLDFAADGSFHSEMRRTSSYTEENSGLYPSFGFASHGEVAPSEETVVTPPAYSGEEFSLGWNLNIGEQNDSVGAGHVPRSPQVESSPTRHHSQPLVPGHSPRLMPSSMHLSRSHLAAFHHSMEAPETDLHISSDGCIGAAADADKGFSRETGSKFEWMGRTVESLLLGHTSAAPLLSLSSNEACCCRMENSCRTECSFCRSRTLRNYSGSSELSTEDNSAPRVHWSCRQGEINPEEALNSVLPLVQNSADEVQPDQSGISGGPNVVLSLLAREVTGKPSSVRSEPSTDRLRAIGGQRLYSALDKPSGGMLSETIRLKKAIKDGDWAETQAIVSRLAPRLIGDPSAHFSNQAGGNRARSIDDPSLPTSASPFHAGGGRLGFEREAFVLSGGVEVFVGIFREQSFVGDKLVVSNDARDLSKDLVSTKLSGCWNEILACLRELTYALPDVIDPSSLLDGGNFLPFLFTLLSHDSCFDGAATLIEEILSFQSQAPPAPSLDARDWEHTVPENASYQSRTSGHGSPTTTFFLGNVPDLFSLWGNFSCRQLAHFCRILALLVFEPEDRQLLESPSVLKSVELLQLRRDRAARAGRDATVDMNQSILLGDPELLEKLLKLLRIMNFSPSLSRGSVYHVMAHFPWIADTLVMLGLSEFGDWGEVDRLEIQARKDEKREEDLGTGACSEAVPLSDLGTIANMLEELSDLLTDNPIEPVTQLGHIIRVINAAQNAGVVGGRSMPARGQNRTESSGARRVDGSLGAASVRWDGASADTVASAVPDNADQDMLRRMYASPVGDNLGLSFGVEGAAMHALHRGRGRFRINSPQDAANELQFNALLLAPYQVEVLFVLCTLLGGRRKIDTQGRLNELGLIPILDDMFYRLSWGHRSESQQSYATISMVGGGGNTSDGVGETHSGSDQEETPNGIHGPGCECNPESALRVQYLRLLHNFCDRDCDNYSGRQLLLSLSEQQYISSGQRNRDRSKLRPGLLSKLLQAFIGEPDDSPYRFWLASCAESFLRGSSPQEQIFAAESGLLEYLKQDVVSERLHCAGSLQTAFDLLGELCKGNPEILHLLLGDVEEDGFRRLMSVAAANLVDSNVFLRSLILSVERIVGRNQVIQVEGRTVRRAHSRGSSLKSYLTHSWWDSTLDDLPSHHRSASSCVPSEHMQDGDECRRSDWCSPFIREASSSSIDTLADSLNLGSDHGENMYWSGDLHHVGWEFSPQIRSEIHTHAGWAGSDEAFSPNSFERLVWFLTANQTRLVRDVLDAVDLRNINHENICCLNTAVVVAVFAYRRQQLPNLLRELRNMNLVEMRSAREARRRNMSDHQIRHGGEAIPESLDMSPMKMRLSEVADGSSDERHSRRVRPTDYGASVETTRVKASRGSLDGCSDVLRNFRELLWFWAEYYTHRGRDRLSLEFSSHVRFQEWKNVVSLLSADDGSVNSLVSNRLKLPRSPYRRPARVFGNRFRGC